MQKGSYLKSKGNLPSKRCCVCHRWFTWRKKWKRDWTHVKYCSERCRRSKHNAENS
ncbi:MAG: DUF2256 domain-containing protein [Bacteroidota bacterium]